MTSPIVRFETMAREIMEKQEHILNCVQCDHCAVDRGLLMRANFQTLTLVRGLVVYLEKIKQDRRMKRRRYKENVHMRTM